LGPRKKDTRWRPNLLSWEEARASDVHKKLRGRAGKLALASGGEHGERKKPQKRRLSKIS